jgi:hypothetical protein
MCRGEVASAAHHRSTQPVSPSAPRQTNALVLTENSEASSPRYSSEACVPDEEGVIRAARVGTNLVAQRTTAPLSHLQEGEPPPRPLRELVVNTRAASELLCARDCAVTPRRRRVGIIDSHGKAVKVSMMR